MTDEDYTTATDDRYERAKGMATVGESADNAIEANLTDELRAMLGLDDDAKWLAHDAKVRRAQQVTEDQERVAEHRRRAQLLKGDEYRFPAIAIDAALATWPTETPAMAAVKSFATSPRRLLVLAGGTGTGKSSAAAWCALEVGGFSPAFLRASELEARGRYDKDLRDWLRGRSMLVLDDLGVEVLDSKNVFRGLLDEIVDSYYGDRKRLVITTNLRKRRDQVADGVVKFEEPQFVERYGERVTSRLMESGLWANCGNNDLRREQVQRP